jgi:hypothetical protein
MLRLFSAGFVLACGLLPTLAGPPGFADDIANGPMRFEWRQEGNCGTQCRTWISASGYIASDTAREFDNFAKNNPNVKGAVIVFDSDGGSVLGAIALGRAIRQLDMITTVGKTRLLPRGADGQRRATLSPEADCESMCAFVLLAGTQRYVPPQARVLVHQIWLGKKRKQALESNYSAEELNIVQRDIGRLAQYTIEMGGSIDLIEVALRVPPWEPLYRLTKDDLARMQLNTTNVLFAQDTPRVSPITTVTSVATVGQPSAVRD